MISAISLRESAPIDLMVAPTLTEHDLALAVALDKDRLLDADRFVLALGPAVGLDGGLIRQFLMQLAIDFFPRDLGRQMPASARPTSGPRVMKRPRRHHAGERLPEIVDAGRPTAPRS